MPIYEYQCQTCAHELEVLQKMSEDPLKKCPSCGEQALRKKISAVAFRLKGGGWYETDFKTGDKKNIAGDKSSSSGSSKEGASSDKKGSSSETKSASSDSSASKSKTVAS